MGDTCAMMGKNGTGLLDRLGRSNAHKRGPKRGNAMPRWTPDPETGRDYATVRLKFPMTRRDYAVIQRYRRDNPDENWTVAEAMIVALQIGLDELAETYSPSRRDRD